MVAVMAAFLRVLLSPILMLRLAIVISAENRVAEPPAISETTHSLADFGTGLDALVNVREIDLNHPV
jgi:hypothetical protein